MMQQIPDPCADLSHGYVLIDACHAHTLDLDGVTQVACVPAALTNIQALMPRLIEVQPLSSLQREQMADILCQQVAGQHPFALCAWLTAEIPVEDLAEHIARLINAPGPGPERRQVLWRYFDPRVFSTTMGHFSLTQREALLGPIRQWRFTWRGHWWMVAGSGGEVDRLADIEQAWPAPDNWPHISLSRLLHRVLSTLDAGQTMTAEQCLASQKAALAYLVDGASTLGLKDEDDLLEFAHLCTRYGKAYRQHPRLRGGWSALQRGDISWTELRFHLDQADFERLDQLAVHEEP